MPKRPLSPRDVAVHVLDRVLAEGNLLSEALGGKRLSRLEAPNRATAQRLATETLRNLGTCDRVLAKFLRKMPPVQVRNVLRLACYELCTGGDAHGIVNDAVGLLGASGRTRSYKGLANAILRKVADQGPDIWTKQQAPRLPDWLREPLVDAYSQSTIAKIERAHQRGAPVDITVKRNAPAWAEKLGGTILPTGSIRLSDRAQVSALEGYTEGAWWVQDAAAALPAKLLNVQSGETVLDMCAAPGGKTMQLAAAGAQVTAIDLSQKRLKRVEENLLRTGLKADVKAEDALTHQSQYDAILLDAPCSATGTIRRHPDLPYVKDGSEFGGLIELQAAMLDHAISLLHSKGRLVFCTCSLLPDEGECQIDEVLKNHTNLYVDKDALAMDGINPDWITPEGGLRLRPDFWADHGGMDGFYMAVLRKV